MRLRIRTCDPPNSWLKGQGYYVRVENAETGELLDGVVGVTWSLTDVRGFATATITLESAELDVEVDDWDWKLRLPGKALPEAVKVQ